MRHLGRTPPFRGPNGWPLPGSIAEVRYLRLGGVDQWVMIRGESVANPPLICLHGGPGMSETGLLRRFNAPLEKFFTLVFWDQRGAGKSFDARLPRSSMTAEQFICDLDELVERVRRKLGQPKVAIFGHSWGSVLGALYAARFGHKVSVYVGGAQVGDWPAAEAASYHHAVQTAERRHHRKAQLKLREIGPPPYSARAVMAERTWVQRLDGHLKPKDVLGAGRALFGGPESSLIDLPNLLRGFRFTLDAMWPEVSQLNLVERVPALQMPVFFLLGRKDHWVPNESSVAYFDALRAPFKQLVWFESSGHEMFVDEPERFNATMIERVRPVLLQTTQGEGRGQPLA
jgi:pimeloyl-ACP methyl ester carboxylesterase